ncbi:MAG: hypothetical protein ACLSIF_06765 [Faecalimonas umbilicata]|jgi:hypothetical protein
MDEKKVREAIEDFKELSIQMRERGFSGASKHCNLAIEALEKQLPKKVKIKTWCPSYCPNCGYELSEDLGDGYYRHPTFLERCPNPDCGQRLDWPE